MRLYSLLLLVLLFIASCQDDDDIAPSVSFDCGPPITIVDQTDVPDSDDFALGEVTGNGPCINISIMASGCTNEGWTLALRTNGDVGESLPTATSAYLIFDDQVSGGATCLAFLNRDFDFDLSPYLNEDVLPTNFTLIGPGNQQTTILVE